MSRAIEVIVGCPDCGIETRIVEDGDGEIIATCSSCGKEVYDSRMEREELDIEDIQFPDSPMSFPYINLGIIV